ncbi:TetR/AcrR family transcriptional regulator [Nakamurella endophytica]|uniref:TetR family transcriptional regulator n=1 Tax=Nakamurella endophytica TaxID=1748367 RepID=A0A917SYQ3_9ACTN|nr:TetR/AcrR family transcriptional regulator [Nakamurella endophytica]GGM04721.1 TetR family transcriptional regulator [Nakamurella endophytica]
MPPTADPDAGHAAGRSGAGRVRGGAARTTGGRAAPMPPEERRAAIVAAAIPLVAQHGPAVTTRQIADAAGVAEGTIFRVFTDKQAVLDEVVRTVTDPAPDLAMLEALDPSRPLRELLTAAADIATGRLRQVWSVLGALRTFESGPPPGAGRRPPSLPLEDPLLVRMCRLLEPHADELRLPPTEVARLLRALVVAGTHPRLAGGHAMETGQIVAVLLDGVRRHGP